MQQQNQHSTHRKQIIHKEDKEDGKTHFHFVEKVIYDAAVCQGHSLRVRY
jgi:hypothetical protein